MVLVGVGADVNVISDITPKQVVLVVQRSAEEAFQFVALTRCCKMDYR